MSCVSGAETKADFSGAEPKEHEIIVVELDVHRSSNTLRGTGFLISENRMPSAGGLIRVWIEKALFVFTDGLFSLQPQTIS
jgi:hypothetical protein